ncbi:MAG: pilin, partial [Patescibacteria group bacterium]
MNILYKKISVILFLGIIFIINIIPDISQAAIDPTALKNACESSGGIITGTTGNFCLITPKDNADCRAKGGSINPTTGTCSWTTKNCEDKGGFMDASDKCFWTEKTAASKTGNITLPSGDTYITKCEGKTVDICKLKTDTCIWNIDTLKCETKPDSVFYNALNSIYTTGTGFVSGLLSKSGRSEYKVIVDIPCDNAIVKIIGGAKCAKTEGYAGSIPLYVARLYQFGFGIVGVVALLMIIIGAAKYTLSAGSFTSKDEAREQITEAIYGILLLFGAYLILYTINPELVSIKAPTLTPVNVEKFLITPATQTTSNTNTPAESSGTNSIANCAITSSEGAIGSQQSVCTQCYIGFA